MATGIVLCCMAALLPPLLLYFPNMGELTLAGMLPFFGIMAGTGFLAWAVMYLVSRRKGFAAVAAAVWLLAVLNAGRLVPAIQAKYPLVGFGVIGPAALAVLLAVTFGLSRLKEEFLKDAAKVLSLTLAAFILAAAVPALVNGPRQDDGDLEPAAEAEDYPEIDIAQAEGTDRPNIYWILSDEYAGSDQLEKYYHYDNTPFYDDLRDMGFTVSEHSYNWYPETYYILGDLLNLNYVSQPSRAAEREKLLADPDLPFWRLLRDLGYEVCEVESKNLFRLTDRLHARTEEDPPITSDGDTVANLLLQYSLLYRYENEILEAVAPRYARGSAKQRILEVFDWAENPDNLRTDRPTFTMIYFMCPHAPFHFDREGNGVTADSRKDPKSYYLDQLVYTTERLRKMCGTIAQADPGAIIVLQSDHGYRFVANVTRLDETNILNAVYFRGKPLEGITDKNALNTWRTVLREQFRLDLPEVKEKRLKNQYVRQFRDPKAEDPNKGLIPEN